MFSRGSAGPPGPGKGATFSFIGPESHVTGDVATPGQLHIDGKVIGDVHCGTLSQARAARSPATSTPTTPGSPADRRRRLGGTLLLETTARITGDVLYETSPSPPRPGRRPLQRRQNKADGSLKTRAVTPPGATARAAPPSPPRRRRAVRRRRAGGSGRSRRVSRRGAKPWRRRRDRIMPSNG